VNEFTRAPALDQEEGEMEEETRDEGLQDLTLATVCDGVLEKEFQERLREAVDVLAKHRRLKKGKDDAISVTLPLEVTLTYLVADGIYEIAAVANPIKPPKPIPTVRPVYRRGNRMKVKPEIQQEFPIPASLPRRGA
jgi:hypothetical protein